MGEPPSHFAGNIFHRETLANVYLEHLPPEDIQVKALDHGMTEVVNCYRDGTLTACLANIPALQVSREHYDRGFLPLLKFMHVSKSPVVVSLGVQLVPRAGRVVCMSGVSLQCRMQDSDIVV